MSPPFDPTLSDPDPEGMKLAGCAGKEAFASGQLANRVVKRRARNGRQGDAYRCRHCGLYHIGRPRRAR